MDLRKDMGEHGLAGRALADCLCGPRYGRLDERPGGGNSRTWRLPDVGWDEDREMMKLCLPFVPD